jgi:hypothetical protein
VNEAVNEDDVLIGTIERPAPAALRFRPGGLLVLLVLLVRPGH